MKNKFQSSTVFLLSLLLTVLTFVPCQGSCRHSSLLDNLPDSVYVGNQMFHVQGLALDRANDCMYFSFTSMFIKTDLSGKVLATIEGIEGHLGAMTLNPEDGKVYASLECKDDEIGNGIANKMNVDKVTKGSSVFYIAVIDVKKLTRMGMNPEKDGVMTTVYVKEAAQDYGAVNPDGTDHRYGCSGIDGVTFAPAVGDRSRKPKLFLYVGYGIYGDLNRKDNDYQVLLQYDVTSWASYERPVKFGQIHSSGPASPLHKYFLYTGNTNYGIQNMAYDSFTGKILLAVYKGRKPQFPNYDLFSLDVKAKAFSSALRHDPYSAPVEQLSLAKDGHFDSASGTYGWHFKWGSTGLCPLGGGYFYISENSKNKDKTNNCNARLYKWTGSKASPFVEVDR
ncbi:MAG: hypothetical protein WCR48_02520 [Bacteroidales bacterium]